MRHLKPMSIERNPQKASLAGHPSLLDSLKGLVSDPLGVVGVHLKIVG